MIVKGYGIELERLQKGDLELVRNWRNADHVKRYMEFRETITPEMQEKWFSSIDTIYHNYFIILVNKEKIGLIYGSNIDWEKNETGNGGIFIWDINYQKTTIPLRASLLLTDLSFLLGFERTFAKVLKDNVQAISYNLNLGYELMPGQENNYNQQYLLQKENYFTKTEKLRRTLKKGSPEPVSVMITDRTHPASAQMIKRYSELTEVQKNALIFDVI